MKIYQDPKYPKHWKTVETDKHKYIVLGFKTGNNPEYEVYHCDDCTLNVRQFLFQVKGSMERVKQKINTYEVSA